MIGKFLSVAVLAVLLGGFPVVAGTGAGSGEGSVDPFTPQLAQADFGQCYKDCIFQEGEDAKATCKLRCGRRVGEQHKAPKDCMKIYKRCNKACKKDKKCKKSCRQSRLTCQ